MDKHLDTLIDQQHQIIELLADILSLCNQLFTSLAYTDEKPESGTEKKSHFLPNGGAGAYHEHELLTVGEAMRYLRISRDTLSRMRKAGELTSLYQKRNVRLIKKEVEAAYHWYSVKRGKV